VELSKYKFQILQDICRSNEVVTAIGSTAPNIHDAEDLIYVNLFPYYQVDGTLTRSDSFVMLKISAPNVNRKSSSFMDMHISFLVISHTGRMRVSGRSATRIDWISEELTKIFHDHNKYGCGILKLVSNDEFVLPTNPSYLCRELIFRTFDTPRELCE
jgi:hypothetical protein